MRLTGRASFWLIAIVVVLTMWGSGGPSMIYPLYISEWHLAPVVVTSIFAVYPIAFAIAVVVFGGISDYLGRKVVIIVGASGMALGALLFAVGPDVSWFFVARVIQGFSSALIMTTASAAMVEYEPNRNAAKASSTNAVAISAGLSISTVAGGAMVQYLPAPLRFSFWALLVMTVAAIVALLFLPAPTTGSLATGRWRPKGLVVPTGLGGVVLLAALATTVAYSMGAVTISLGAQIAKSLVNTENALVAGCVIGVFAATGSTISFFARRLKPSTSIGLAGVVAVFGMGLLVATALSHSLVFFLLGAIIAGASNGLFFTGGIGLVARYAPVHHRAGTIAIAYLACYLTQGILGIALGFSVTGEGLGPALETWSIAIAAFSVAVSLVALLLRMPGEPRRGFNAEPAD